MRLAGYAAGVALSIVAAALLVRHLGIVGFGDYVLVTAVMGIVAGLTEAGITGIGVREYCAREGADRDRAMGTLLAIRVVLALAGAAIAVIFVVAAGYRDELVIGTAVVTVGLIAQVLQAIITVPLQADLRLGSLTLLDLVRRGLFLAVVAVLVATDQDLPAFFVAVSAAAVPALVLAAFLVRGTIPLRPRFDRSMARDILRDSVPFGTSVAISSIYIYITVVLVSLLSSALETGYFATGFRIVQVVLVVPSLLLNAVFPLLTRAGGPQDRDLLARRLARTYDVTLIAGALLALALAAGAQLSLSVVAGAQGAGAEDVLTVQATILLPSFLVSTTGFALLASGRLRPMLVSSVLTLVVDVALGLALIPPFGAVGGAVGDVVTEVALAGVLTAYVWRALPGSRPSARTVRAVAAATAAGVLVALLPLGQVMRPIAAVVAFVVVVVALRGVPPELRIGAPRLTR